MAPGRRGPERRPRSTVRCRPRRQRSGLMAQVQDAIEKGAKIHTGGPGCPARAPSSRRPSSRVTPDMRAYRRAVRPRWPGLPVHDVTRGPLANDTRTAWGVWSTHSDPAWRSRPGPLDTRDGVDQRARRRGPSCRSATEAVRRRARSSGLWIDEFVNGKLIHAPLAADQKSYATTNQPSRRCRVMGPTSPSSRWVGSRHRHVLRRSCRGLRRVAVPVSERLGADGLRMEP